MYNIQPAVTVIIPTYNRMSTIDRAIDSVLNQDYNGEIELIIVDDASTDGSNKHLELRQKNYSCKNLKLKKTIKLLQLKKNLGVSAARNTGINNSNHDWVSFLDSDDQWLPHKLSEQISLLQQKPKIKICHGEENWIRNGSPLKQLKKHKKHGGRIYQNCLALCLMSPSTIIIHKSIFNDVGLFNQSYPVCEDYDLWLRITAKYEVGFVSKPIINKYGGHSDQLSHKFKAMDYWRVKSLFQALNSPYISSNELELTKETLIKKSEILMKGYKKYNNIGLYPEIEAIHKQVKENNLL